MASIPRDLITQITLSTPRSNAKSSPDAGPFSLVLNEPSESQASPPRSTANPTTRDERPSTSASAPPQPDQVNDSKSQSGIDHDGHADAVDKDAPASDNEVEDGDALESEEANAAAAQTMGTEIRVDAHDKSTSNADGATAETAPTPKAKVSRRPPISAHLRQAAHNHDNLTEQSDDSEMTKNQAVRPDPRAEIMKTATRRRSKSATETHQASDATRGKKSRKSIADGENATKPTDERSDERVAKTNAKVSATGVTAKNGGSADATRDSAPRSSRRSAAQSHATVRPTPDDGTVTVKNEIVPSPSSVDDGSGPAVRNAADNQAGQDTISSSAPQTAPAQTHRLQDHLVPRAARKTGESTNLSQADQSRFLQRVARAFDAAKNRDGEIRLRLSPPELGSLRLEVRVVEGAMIARLEAETPATRTLLIDNLPALRERLAEQGVRIEQFDIDLLDRRDQGGLPDQGHSSDDSSTGQRHETESQRPVVSDTPAREERSGFDSPGSQRINVII